VNTAPESPRAKPTDSSSVITASTDRGTGTERGAAADRGTGTHRGTGSERAAGYARPGTAAAAGTALAGVLMIISGLWAFFEGLTAIVTRHFYGTVANYTFRLNIHGWGWLHLILGIVMVAAGASVLLGMTWARRAGIALAAVSALANFLFIPYYPVWSLILIALNVFIIWALTTGLQHDPA